MLRKLPVNNFEWIKDTSQFNEDFMSDVQYPEKLHKLHNDLLFLSEGIKIGKSWKACS